MPVPPLGRRQEVLGRLHLVQGWKVARTQTGPLCGVAKLLETDLGINGRSLGRGNVNLPRCTGKGVNSSEGLGLFTALTYPHVYLPTYRFPRWRECSV